MLAAALVTLAAAALAAWVLLLLRRRSRRRLPPGPRGLPLLGYLPWLDAAAPHLTLTSLARRYGRVYGLQLGGVRAVVAADHRVIRRALASEAFSGRAPLYLTHGIMQGYGLICAEGALWKDQRKFVSTCLKNFGMVKFGAKRAKLEKRIMCGVKECVEDLRRSAGAPEDPVHTLQHSVGNVVNSLVFGRTWPEHDAVWRWLRRLQEDGTKLVGVAGPLNFLPFLRLLPRYRRTMQYLMSGKEKTHQVYQSLIEERAAALQDDGGGGGGLATDPSECEDVLAAFLAEMSRRRRSGQRPPGDGSAAEEEDFFSTPQFHHLLADLFGAGLDTTLTTLRWFLLYVAARPDVQVTATAVLLNDCSVELTAIVP